jgi:hypothetical protein
MYIVYVKTADFNPWIIGWVQKNPGFDLPSFSVVQVTNQSIGIETENFNL